LRVLMTELIGKPSDRIDAAQDRASEAGLSRSHASLFQGQGCVENSH
jgi:hypothetical protein